MCDLVIRTCQRFLGPLVRYYMTEAETAALCKYVQSSFLLTKVAFVNQFCGLSQARGVSYSELREFWLADERIGAQQKISTRTGFLPIQKRVP